MWPHLTSKELDQRFEIVAKYLKFKVKGKHILDFNCGTGKFATFIKGFASYYGNDIYKVFISKTPRLPHTKFEIRDDATLIKYLNNSPINIILFFGMTVGHLEKNSPESTTADKSFKLLVKSKKPLYIIMESCREYTKKYSLLATYIKLFSNQYKVDLIKKVDGGPLAYHQRQIVILKRKSIISSYKLYLFVNKIYERIIVDLNIMYINYLI